MSDADLIIELWFRLKPFVAAKERVDAAEAIIAVFDEQGMADDLSDNVDNVDKQLAAAIKSYFGVDTDEEDDDGHIY